MRVLIDACVLYPTLLRQIVLAVARSGAIEPLWSARILEEWRRAALREHPAQAEALAAEIALTRAAWPKAEISPEHALEDRLSLPDPNDVHVLAAALNGQAELILTLNLRDFPARSLGRLGLRAEHPDPFLLRCWQDDPETIGPAILGTVETARAMISPPPTPRALLKKSRLPRLAKALARV